jgi:probable F420-dependent oxidoreductase
MIIISCSAKRAGRSSRRTGRPTVDATGFEHRPERKYGSAVSVRIGLGLFTGQVPPGSQRTFATEYREMLDLVRLAEAVGFDSAWVSEHHGASDGYLPSLLPMLAAFAAVTERIRLGTGIVLTPFHDPLRLAEDAAVVDQLSEGRLILGLGIGWREEEFRMFGVPMRERLARTTETIEILRRAWTGRRFSFHGRRYRYDRVKVTPPPARPGGPPIYLGGYAERAVRRAGRLADGYITDADAIEEVRPALAVFDEGAREVGKDPHALGLALLQNAFVSREGDAWEMARPGVAHQLGTYSAWDAGADTPDHDELEPIPPDDATMRRWTAAGTPAEVVRSLRPLVEAFGDRSELHLIVRLHYPGMDFETASRAVEVFAEEVAPGLKGD